MDNSIVTIIVAILSSGALSALINGFFQSRRDKQSKETGLESKVDDIKKKQDTIIADQKKQEGDILRVELKLMISDFPEKEDDILRLAEHYFGDMHRNWVMGSTFQQWLDDRGLDVPNWYHKE